MKTKTLTALAAFGLAMSACGDSEFIKFENANPTIDAAKFDRMATLIKEKVSGSNFEIYHVESAFTNSNVPDVEKGKLQKRKQKNELINDYHLEAFLVDKDNKAKIGFVRVSCDEPSKYRSRSDCYVNMRF